MENIVQWTNKTGSFLEISTWNWRCMIHTAVSVSTSGTNKISMTIDIIITHHQVVLMAWIPLILFHHLSLSAIALDTAASVHRELMNVSLCWSANTAMSKCRSPKENFTSELVLTSSAVFKIVGKWQYSCCFVECCLQG